MIPVYRKSGIVNLKIRCISNADSKYHQVKGSDQRCLILGDGAKPLVIVESDLDGYLIWQEAKKMVNVLALGGVNSPIDDESKDYIGKAPRLLIATDYDKAGQLAFQRLKEEYPHADYFPPAAGKDPCEMDHLGISVGTWIESCFAQERKLPKDCCITWDALKKGFVNYPHLVPCPRTTPPWQWVYRKDCKDCKGHIRCLKGMLDLSFHPFSMGNTTYSEQQRDDSCA